MPTWARRALPYAVAGGVFLVLLLALFWRLWTPIDGARRAFNWDAQWEYWGDLIFQYDSYRDGALPLWNPFDRAGYPFHCDPQAGILYPPNWLLLAGSAIAGHVSYGVVTVKVVLHIWLACFGLFVYLRRRGLHTAACYAGGVIFVVGYPHLHNLFSALNWNIAWAPWILAAVDHWAARPSRGRGALVALTGALCALAGGPASFWFSLLVVVPYAVWAIVDGARAAAAGAGARPYLREALVSGAASLGLFLAMVAAQFHSTSLLLGETVRDRRDLSFITESVLGMNDIAGLLMPRMLGENTYIGAATAVWAALAVSAFATPRRLVLAGVAALGLGLALGDAGDFLAAAASAIEPFGWFRRAHRYMYVAQLPIAILAAEGLHELVRLDDPERARRIARGVWFVGGAAVLVFGIGFAVNQKPGIAEQPLRDAFVLACVSFVLATWLNLMLLHRRGRGRALFAYLAAAAVTADLWFAHSRQIDQGMLRVPDTSHDREVAGLDGVPLSARIYDRSYLKFRPGIRLGLRDLGGYEGDPLALVRYDRVLERVRREPRLLGHLNVAWLLEGGDKVLKADRTGLATVRKGVSRVASVAPAVLWVDRAVVVDGPEAAAKALFAAPVGQIAVVERGRLRPADEQRVQRADGAVATAAGRLVELGRNRVVAEIDAPADGIAIVHEAFFPGWSARVDGEAAQVIPANAAFRGVLVGPGRHRIEMEYRAGAWPMLALLSVLGSAGAALVAIWPAVRARRRRRQTG
ncbi:MAG TPA: hypothetical protein VKB80_11655 [Kofleriaceae bacterium]|nr:hypothetical protein [Kofleriaceae bacterium]